MDHPRGAQVWVRCDDSAESVILCRHCGQWWYGDGFTPEPEHPVERVVHLVRQVWTSPTEAAMAVLEAMPEQERERALVDLAALAAEVGEAFGWSALGQRLESRLDGIFVEVRVALDQEGIDAAVHTMAIGTGPVGLSVRRVEPMDWG